MAFTIPKPRPPTEPDPPIPPLPDRRPRDMPRAVFDALVDALAAMCRCTAGCAQNFADDGCYRLHRPHGVCLPPAQVGLTRQDTPAPCWAREEHP